MHNSSHDLRRRNAFGPEKDTHSTSELSLMEQIHRYQARKPMRSPTLRVPQALQSGGSPMTTMTPENGTVALPVSTIDGYNIIIAYQGASYSVGDVFIAPVQITTATLSIPSGNVTVAHSAPAPT